MFNLNYETFISQLNTFNNQRKCAETIKQKRFGTLLI